MYLKEWLKTIISSIPFSQEKGRWEKSLKVERLRYSAVLSCPGKSEAYSFIEYDEDRKIKRVTHRLSKKKLQEVWEQSGFPHIATLISSRDSIHHRLDLNLKSTHAIKSVVPFQMEPFLPYPVDEAVFQSYTSCTQGSLQVEVVSTQENKVRDIKERFLKAGLTLDVLTTEPLAVYGFHLEFTQEKEPCVYVVQNEKRTLFVCVDSKGVIKGRELSIGSREIEADPPVFNRFETECKKIKLYLRADNLKWFLCDPKGYLSQVFEGATLLKGRGDCELLAKGISYILRNPSLFSTNFLSGNLSSRWVWEKHKKQLFSFARLSLALSACFWLIFSSTVWRNNRLARNHYKEVIKELKLESNDRFWPDKHSYSGFAKQTRELKEYISTHTAPYPLTPNTPTALDALKWLHKVSSSVAPSHEDISINAFSYELETLPTSNKKKQRYQTKVSVDFSISNNQVARDLQSKLSKSKEVIDLKRKVQWKNKESHYSATFYLNDKTEY